MGTRQTQRKTHFISVAKRAISNLSALNEAYDYPRPSSFFRGMRIGLDGLVILLISGTASILPCGPLSGKQRGNVLERAAALATEIPDVDGIAMLVECGED